MRRAAVSISSNLAEGSSRVSRPDFARFVEIATGSLFEVVSQMTIGKRQGFISESAYAAVYVAAEKQNKKCSAVCGNRRLRNQSLSTFTQQPSTNHSRPSCFCTTQSAAAREILVEFVLLLCENGLVPGSVTRPTGRIQ
jgi:four helix bundle protein